MSRLTWILLCNLLLSRTIEAYKALVLSPLPSKSHSILADSLVKLIAEAGNEVTYVTSFPRENPPARVREIAVLGETEKTVWSDGLNLKAMLDGEVVTNKVVGFMSMLHEIGLKVLQNNDLQKLLNDPNETFDVVIAEWMYNDVYAGLAPIFKCPFIWFSPMEVHWMIIQTVDKIPSPTYTTDVLSTNRPPFTFIQRVQELWFQMFGVFLDYFHTSKLQNQLYYNVIAPIIRKRGNSVPSYEEVKFNASLILGNSHVSLGSSMSLPRNYKEIAGFHIAKNAEPLTGDLKKLLDNAKHGVIYFSLGSNVKSKTFPDSLTNSLLKMFGELKQTVLWKFEGDIAEKPSNVHTMNWVPQNSILAHPNCILFISHGGYLSIIESIHFAKPQICIPIFGDQFSNVARAVQMGFAKKVDLNYAMADNIREAIYDMLGNTRYSTRAKELSFVYFHRPSSPATELVHWVDHVVQTRGAGHMRSPALFVHWYQKMYLDLLLVIVLTIFGLKILVKRSFSALCRKEKSKKKKDMKWNKNK